MRRFLPVVASIAFFLFLTLHTFAQSSQTVANGASTTVVNFGDAGCTYNWVNSNTSIGLPASGTGNIASFTAINTGTIPVKATITATPAAEGSAYIANESEGTLSIINVSTNTVVTTLKPSGDPFAVCISPDGSRVYIGCGGGSNSIAVINTVTNQIINTIPVNSNGENTGVTVSPDGTLLYAADYRLNTVSVVNIATGTVVAVIPVGSYPYSVAVSPDGSKVYVGYTYNNYFSVINTATHNVINVTVGLSPSDLVVGPDGSIYVSVSNLSQVDVINPATNTITKIIPTGAASSGNGVLAINATGTRLYVSAGNFITVINPATSAIIANIAIPSPPNGISVSPDGQFVYVADSDIGVSVISALTNTIITTVQISGNPVSIGNFISPGTGCTGTPTTFTITVNPAEASPPAILVSNASGIISSCEGTASVSPNIQQITVSGSGLTANMTAVVSPGFDISLSAASGYGNNLTLAPINGVVGNTVIYVRSSAAATGGAISGGVLLASPGAENESVIVNGNVNIIPSADAPGSQVLVNGAPASPVNFTGTASIFNWVNDTPGIGLPASGTGNIGSFTAINTTSNPIVATITVTPLNNTGCSGTPVTFTITVNQSPELPPALAVTANLNQLATIYGTPSVSESFQVSGTNISGGILITPPAGFEVSNSGVAFSGTVNLNGNGNIPPAAVYIRLAATTAVGIYSGNIILSTNNLANTNLLMSASMVSPAPLTITADNLIKPYGAVNPALTVTYLGFVNNDGPGQLKSLPAVSTTALTQSPVGAYPVLVSGAIAANYTITYLPGILTIEPALSSLSIPNTFTPNGDGINDTWEIKDLEYYPKTTVNIFTRWGQNVFSSIGYPNPWNGTFKGRQLASGTYYYIIDPKNGHRVFVGWLELIR